MKKTFCFTSMLVFILLLVGCQPPQGTIQEETQKSSPTIDSSTISIDITVRPVETGPIMAIASAEVTPVFDPGVKALISLAKNDLHLRTGLSPDKISVIDVEAVEWSDSSLGCPQPGMDYLQVITSGYRILLDANAQVFEYHSNRDTYVIYCENPDGIIFLSNP